MKLENVTKIFKSSLIVRNARHKCQKRQIVITNPSMTSWKFMDWGHDDTG